jgi:DNA-binding response OmpR family regulator
MLEELKAQYRDSLAEKVRSIRALLDEYRAGKEEALSSLRLLAHSLHGSGTTFGFPRISEAARRVEHADTAAMLPALAVLLRVLIETARESTAQVRILLIEDDPDISNLLRALLTQKSPHYAVRIAATAAAAREELQQAAPTCVVLDLVLPDGDGRALLREIRESLPESVSVCVLSGVDRPAIRDECLALGARSFFSKPFDPQAIAASIQDMLHRHEPAAAPPLPAARADSGSGRRVLVAEDDELLAGIIKHRLSREGFTVVHVSDGAAALDEVARGEWVLAILDVKMPVRDGFEVLAAIRADKRHHELPVIMLTAMGSEKDVVRGYDKGANDYMVKPFSPVELLARVKSLVRS